MTQTDRNLGLVANLGIKVPCRVATTANITLSGEQTIDGIACVTDDRVLVKNQASSVNNGIYVVDTGTWSRAQDCDGTYDLVQGSLIKVNFGTVTAGFWYVSNANPIVVGTTSLTFAAASTPLAVVSAFVQTLLDDPTAAAFMTTLGISTFVQTILDDTTASAVRTTIDALENLGTTKGDIIAYTAADTPARKAVGTDGYSLMPSSGASDGLAYVGTPSHMVNGYLSCAVNFGAGTATISLKTAAGNDASDADPIFISFRSSTRTSGAVVVRKLTAASSITISNGSTLGGTASVPIRVWVVIFDDNGTLRMGVINCRSTDCSIVSLQDNAFPDGVASSTAEGGAGGADTAGVIYTGTAVSNKAMRVLGYVEWFDISWGLNQDLVQNWVPGMKLPGDVVQSRYTETGAVATGTTAMVIDDTIPTNTEGDQYMTLTLTSGSIYNVLEFDVQAQISNSNAAQQLAGSLFVPSFGAPAVAVVKQFSDNGAGNAARQLCISHRMVAPAVGGVTANFRAGGSTGATTTFNGSAGTRQFGGVYNSFMRITEYMV